MKRAMIAVVSVVAVMLAAGAANAAVATAYVGTANAAGAFDVQDGGNQLYFRPQPDTASVWMKNNGSPADTIWTYPYNGQTYNRDGMKTYAATDIAYGKRLDSLKMEFDYYVGTDPTTGFSPLNTPAINVNLTDGAGHYAIWSATSGGTPFTTTRIGTTDWYHLSMDLTTIANNTWGQMNEYNGGLATNRPMWNVIQGWTVAGFYDFQAAPQGGFGAWNQTLWGDITNVGVVDTTLNDYGVLLIWGDTVGGRFEDGLGEIGVAANRDYGWAGRMVRNYDLTVDGTVYDMTFAAAPVPEPATMCLLALGGLAMLRRRRSA